MPTKQDKLHARALELFNAQQFDQALEIYKRLFTLNRDDAQAWHMAGAIAGMSGDYTAATKYSMQAVNLSPQSHGPCLNLATILQATRDFHGAMHYFQRALELKPGDPQALTGIASLHARLNEFTLAEKHLQSIIRSNPQYTDAYNALGNIYRETSRPDAAIACFQQALRIRPDYIDALCNLGAVLSEQLHFAEADACYSTALRYQPGNPSVLHGYGNLQQSMGDYDKARVSYQQALRQNPADTGLLSSLATLHERCGEQAAATKVLAPLIQSRQFTPDAAVTYAKLCRKSGDYETAIQVLKDTLKTPQNPTKIIDLHFSLGELYDQSGKYEEAFWHFRKANDLDARTTPAADYPALIKVITEFYNRQHWPALPRSTTRSELPVFIVGMPRSGTSLVEQILASHPQVSPGGERGDMITMLESLGSITGPGKILPVSLDAMTTSLLDELAEKHLSSIGLLSQGHLRFTDKTPLHGILLGFINQLLPGSRIIICNRDAQDTCLSVYFHHFNAFHGYARHLDTLGSFYREYYTLMEHWIDILDVRILQVQYEELVQNPDDVIRGLIEFCGLDWDENCLSFHKNKRIVNTPSYNQVRSPIYTSSIERWKHYDKYLDPLRAAINGK